MPVDPEDVLAHYGVKGMKWGRRKAEDKTVTITSKTSGKSTEIHYNPKKAEAKDGKLLAYTRGENKRIQKQYDAAVVKNLSDDELRKRINRLQMEKQYSQLTAAEVNPGKKIVTDLLATTAKNVAASYAQQYARKGIDALIAQAAKK